MEDCCCNTDKTSHEKNEKGGKTNMDTKKIILWAIIAILAIAVVYVVFFRGSGISVVSNAASSAGQAVQSSAGMVGGC